MSSHLMWNLWNSLGNFGILLAKAYKNTEITQTRFINFILNDYSCKILFLSYLIHKKKNYIA